LLVIEVKGGRVACRNGEWSSTDHEDVKWPIKDPYKQAEQSKHALQKKIANLEGWSGVFITHGHAVVFPDCTRSRDLMGPHIIPELTSFSEDLSSLGKRIEGAFGYWRGNSGTNMAIKTGQLRVLEKFLQPRFELNLSPAMLVRDAENVIVKATAGQMMVLDFLSRHNRARIPGVAGSGKTLLAVERALRFARLGMRTLLTCFNRGLAEELRARIGEEPNLLIRTYHHYCLEMAQKAGVLLSEQPTDADELRRWYEEDHPEWLDEALRRLPEERFDAIVVDEGQDFGMSWWVTLTDSLTDPAEGPLYVFYDPAQAIYRPSNLPMDLPEMGFLGENMRNSEPIGKLVRSLVASEMKVNGPNGPAVEWHAAESPQEAKQAIKKIVNHLKTEMGLSLKDIAVLTTHAPAKCGLGAEGVIGTILVTPKASDTSKMLLATAQSFKGQERPAVILAGLDESIVAERCDVLYVAMSRARVFLGIVGTAKGIDALRARVEERQA
jgi:hypothetical protein